MWKTAEGSTGRLVQLCSAYFFFYVIFGVATKCFTGRTAIVSPVMNDMEFLVWSTLGGSLICLLVVFAGGWYRTKTDRFMRCGPLRLPVEYAYIIPSGFCTAVVIPTTTLMYMLLKSVMVAMIIMRASVIVISRVVDEVQISRGILHKKVYREENIAVVFAIAAAGTQICLTKAGDFDFLANTAAMAVLSAYIMAYAVRIYIMNFDTDATELLNESLFLSSTRLEEPQHPTRKVRSGAPPERIPQFPLAFPTDYGSS
ncbi:MAG: hypothetical protein WCI75_10210 [candidate division NC10 bacterium]